MEQDEAAFDAFGVDLNKRALSERLERRQPPHYGLGLERRDR
jgi:hypothetical protein